MEAVHYASCGAAVLGDDILAGAVGPQQRFTFPVPEGGCYDVDVQLVDSNRNPYLAVFRAVQVETGQTATITVTNPATLQR